MKNAIKGLRFALVVWASGIVANATLAQGHIPVTGTWAAGTVTDASTGLPLIGATITVGMGATAQTTLSVIGGAYLTPQLPISGAQPIVIGKTGYDNFAGTINLLPNDTATQNCTLLPTAVQPGPVTAALTSPNPGAVNISWGVPQGLYELLYDDGIQDSVTFWASAGNLNALRFTPLAWPVQLLGGKVDIGTQNDYPASALPLQNFIIFACKADGPGGVPGTILDSVEVTPSGFGWRDFSFINPITINSGDFYLVMKQGGVPPHATRLGVDNTDPLQRSYSRDVSGGLPWSPFAGNFMIRAKMKGAGGPVLSDYAVMYDNGPMATSTGTGYGGADESMVQAPLTVTGSNFNHAISYRVADDFSVGANSWIVNSIEFYGYQTGSTTTSTINGAYCRILNGIPGQPGTTVVWGDTTTNRLSSTSFTNIYRVTTTGSNQRPIMRIMVNTTGLTLTPGNYWIEFSASGTLASGPWCPYVTINNTPVTGNGLAYTGTAGGYAPINQTYGQGVPFKINGYEGTPGPLSYQVWRLKQGQQGNQALWTSIWTGYATSTVDNGWPALPCGPYMWVVKAIYSPPGQRPSAPVYSNAIGKCWTAEVNVCVSLSCAAETKEGTFVKLVNTDYPDTSYLRVTDTSGCVHLPNVWKGNYQLTISRFTYPVHNQNFVILGNISHHDTLVRDTLPVNNLAINDQTLKATWSPPRSMVVQFDEQFSTGGFTANQWTISGGSNWQLSSSAGNPVPSAIFSGTPQQSGYNQYLTSKTLTGLYAPQMKLRYDIALQNSNPANLNSLAVELWNGTAWTVLKTYDNSSGMNIPWTTETLDISSLTNSSSFRFRFHAYGTNSSGILNWIIDNITVYSSKVPSDPDPCVTGYDFYLDNVLIATPADTVFTIPPAQVTYGQPCNICVSAIYANGNSPQSCVSLVAHYLPPVQNLNATPNGNNIIVTWEKPMTPVGEPAGLAGYNVYRNNSFIHHCPGNDSIFYLDQNLMPGTYLYFVKSRYDLTPYGFPGQFGEAYSPGPVQVVIIPSAHFSPVWSGTPFAPMSIVVIQALTGGVGLGAGDEIGIFDSTICVGSYRLTEPINLSHPPAIIVSKDKLSTPAIDGYSEGHEILYKIWNSLTGQEAAYVTHTFPLAPNYVSETFAQGDTAVVSLAGVNVPSTLVIPSTTITGGQTACFNAVQTLTVAGNGKVFHVLAGGEATMIAGEKISYLPGVYVAPGGAMHGYISTNGLYCYGLPPLAPEGAWADEEQDNPGTRIFRVFPNPTHGKVTIQSNGYVNNGSVSLNIYSMIGGNILQYQWQTPFNQEVDLTTFPPGIYLFHFVTNTQVVLLKIIKN